MSRKKKMIGLLSCETLIMILLGIVLIVRWRSSQDIDVSITDWESDYVAYDNDNGWHIDEELAQDWGPEEINLVHSPDISLKKGSYCAKIEYHCNWNQSCRVIADDGQNTNLKIGDNDAALIKSYDKLTYKFEVKDDVDDLQLLIRYNGKGYLQITNIEIEPTFFGALRNVSILMFILFVVDICILCADQIRHHRKTLAALLGISILTSLPLLQAGIRGNVDLWFHLIRIEGIAREIRWGNIPVKLSSIWIGGYGYPVSVYYGDLLLYVPAVLRLIGFSVTAAYEIFIGMINIGTAVITYWCMKKVCSDKSIAMLMCLLYCAAPYRLLNLYARNMVGTYCAAMFIPIIAAAVYKIYTDDISDYKEYKHNALLLAVGMSGVIGTHVLSTQMIVIILLIIVLTLFKRTFRKKTLAVYCMAVLETCLISAYFIVPFLDYYINVPTAVSEEVHQIGQNAASFSSFAGYFRFLSVDWFAPGPILMIFLIFAGIYCLKHRDNKVLLMLIIYSWFILILATSLFPWDSLSSVYLLGNWMSTVQFPYRYIGIANILLILLFGITLQETKLFQKMRYKRCGILVITLICCFYVFRIMDSYSETTYVFDGSELDTYDVVQGEYLKDGTSRYSLDGLEAGLYAEDVQEAVLVSRQGSSMSIRCIASDEEGVIIVPMFNYKGYHVTDDNGVEYEISDGYNNQIEFFVPAGFNGYLQVEYREPWYWRLAELISLVTVLALCIRQGMAVIKVKKYNLGSGILEKY